MCHKTRAPADPRAHPLRGRGGALAATVVASLVCQLALGPLPAHRESAQGLLGHAYASGNRALDAIQPHLVAVLEANRKGFQGRSGRVRGFGAGSTYPQIWVRDSATLVPITRFGYPRAYLDSWLEEFLCHQQPSGELLDWVASGKPGHFRADAPHVKEVYRSGAMVLAGDRNTTELDQESSAVQAAHEVVRITGDLGWLRKDVAGQPVLDRLDRALSYVWREHRHEGTGLLENAMTADWGDVSPSHADQRAIYLDDATPVVVGLYTNALFVRAADCLAELHDLTQAPVPAALWRGRAAEIRLAIDRDLWQADKGFYRMQLPVAGPSDRTATDTADIFALGGNALAVLYGIAGPRKTRSIVNVAEERAAALGVSTVAGTLLPPFPDGFFQHPILRDAFQYQNGGQWDWIAGRMVLAAFQQGQAEWARRHLAHIAARIDAAGGLFEWYTRDGRPMGSPRYAGNAGALGAAIYQGLYGIDLSASGLRLDVRLGSSSGEIRLHEPSTGTTVAYRHEFDAVAAVSHLHILSNAPGEGPLALLIPREMSSPLRVRKDGRDQAFHVNVFGDDRYVALGNSDWRGHQYEIAWRRPYYSL